MKSFVISLTLIFVAGVCAVLFYVVGYNGLVSRQQNVNEKWKILSESYIERNALIMRKVQNNLDDSMQRQLAGIEGTPMGSQILDDETKFRDFSKRIDELEEAIQKIPFDEEIAEIKKKIVFNRQEFQRAMTEYNDALGIFPSNLVARLAGFRNKSQFAQILE